MNKKLLSSTLLIILIGGFGLGCALRFDIVHASTEITGVINTSTAWNKVDSPFDLTGPVLVAEGVTLTVEAGVTVNLNGYYIRVDGTLCARGEAADKIYFLGGSSKPPNWSLMFTAGSTSWDETDGSGCVIENAVINSTHAGVSIENTSPRIDRSVIVGYYAIDVSGGSPMISNNIINGEIGVHSAAPTIVGNNITGHVLATVGKDPVEISNNTIVNWNRNVNVSGIVCSNAHVYGNVVCGFPLAGITLESTWGPNATIERNIVMHNSVGINVSRRASPSIQYNTVANNSVGIEVNQTCSPRIHYNNIMCNSQNSVYLAVASNDVDAANNWWGTKDIAAINQSIFDFEDDFNLGTVAFMPFLTEPHPDAPSVASAPEFTPPPTPTGFSPEPSTTSSLRNLELAILALLIVIAGLLVVTIFLLLRKEH
ncbi:hypothetical protein E2P60_02795 [Candidatus Bathyarchaeota archaeon]|nr:hypothetical protein E2P60_02795 [Candidatus Bathyarchaeota archaeon]